MLGTGGTILKNYNFIGDSAFFVAHADNLTKFDLEDFINFHKNRKDGILITMMTFQTPNPESCGIVEVDKYGIVTAFHEKVQNPPGNIANGAIYIFEKEIIDYMKLLNKTEFDISLDIIPNFLGMIQTYMNHRYHRDIGTLDSLKAAQFDFNDRY